MKTLHYDDIDITGFAGIRERMLLMDPGVFTHNRPDIVWQGFGQLTYLAHAFFRPHGSTGKHYHEGIDVISILTRGRVMHLGSAGNGKEFHTGQVMVQRSGKKGFAHDEINPENDITGMVQIWLRPEGELTESPTHTLIDLQPGINPIYEGQTTGVHIQVLGVGETLDIPVGSLGYVYRGGLETPEQPLPRGTLFISEKDSFKAVGPDTRVLCAINVQA